MCEEEMQLFQKNKDVCDDMDGKEWAEAIKQAIEALVSNPSMREKKSS